MKKIKGFIDPISLGIALVLAVSATMVTIDQKEVNGQQQLAEQTQTEQAIAIAE